MADHESQPTKAAKKNKKRHQKAGSTDKQDLPLAPAEVLALLKEELEHAKANKDHSRASKLREQIWVITDLVAGVRTNLPDEELAPILESIAILQPQAQTSPEASSSERSRQGTGLTTTERKIKNLNKKLDQIKALKEKQAKGEQLEANQIEKIKTEEEIMREKSQLEDVLASLQIH